MEWIFETAMMSAMRLSGGRVVFAGIQDIFFVAPSVSGDRLVFQTCVNRVFGHQMEVGVWRMTVAALSRFKDKLTILWLWEKVRVDLLNRAGERKQINRAYLTFVAVGEGRVR